MKQKILNVLCGIIIFFGFHVCLKAQSARGRVKVVNNGAYNYTTGKYDATAAGYTVVTDQGTLLRGTTVWMLCDNINTSQYLWSWNRSAWKVAARNGLNAVRLSASYTSGYNGNTEKLFFSRMDSCIKWAKQECIYVMIDHHEVGTYTMDTLRTFWVKVAKKYANETNVLFEISNEPVAWYVKDYTDQDVKNFKEIHDTIRKYAPLSHIVFFSFAVSDAGMDTWADKLTTLGQQQGRPVDWTKCSVAFHGYHRTASQPITTLKTKYPCINSEWSSSSNSNMLQMDGSLWNSEVMEKLRISWFNWDGNPMSQDEKNITVPMINDAKAKNYYWTPDNYNCNVATNINSVDQFSEIAVYPNPFHTSFNIKIPTAILLKNTVMELYDVCGKQVKIVFISGHETLIERGELQSGLYFYTIINNNDRIVNGKLVLQ